MLRTLPDRVRANENFDLNIEALQDANVAGAAVSAVDAGTCKFHRRRMRRRTTNQGSTHGKRDTTS